MPLEPKSSSRVSCFHCEAASVRPLVVLSIEGYPPGDTRHNIGYKHDAIFICDNCRHGYAEQRRHDCFDFDEVWDQDEVCQIEIDDIARLAEGLAACPDPLQETCTCPVHESLRSSWKGIPLGGWGSRALTVKVTAGLPQLR